MATANGAGVASPCISICRMHEPTGWCEGCLRTIDEIAVWGQLDDAARRTLMQRLGPRRAAWRAMKVAARQVAEPGADPATSSASAAGPSGRSGPENAA
jgi:predicted Fe-S protein YdhL (DUF1289 family)